MEQKKIFQVNFSHFPKDERAAQIPDKIFLIDNFEEKSRMIGENEVITFPVQITMSLTMLCTCGHAEILINMQKYDVQAGTVISVSPGSFFQWHSASEDIECACIAINQGVMPINFDVKLGLEIAMKLKANPVFTPTDEDFSGFLATYRNIKQILMRKDFAFREEVAMCHLEILRWHAMDRVLKEKNMEPSNKEQHVATRKEQLFMRFIAAVQEHYTSERNVGFYADLLCVSPKYLSAVIHDVSGKYATNWINDYVILECKAMLKTENESVKSVCNKLNFANQSFFAKFFKQHTGMTPREYRNK